MDRSTNKTRKIKAAAVQMESKFGRIDLNIARATTLIEKAAAQDANLIVLPEMCIPGYTLTHRVWDMAEPAGGFIERWLRDSAKRLGAYIGAGMVKTDGEDFYNSYLISDPDGKIIGRVHKTQTEFAFFRAGDPDSHIIDTGIGRIGVGICADNHRTFLPALMREKDVDILLMPHAIPAPFKTSRLIKEKDIEDAEAHSRDIGPLLSGILGIPVVCADQTGPLYEERWWGILGRLIDADHFRYAGCSAIVDSDLAIRAQIQREEGVICTEVTFDPLRKRKGEIPDHLGWLNPGSAIMRRIILPIESRRGMVKYRKSTERKRRALEISNSTSWEP